MIRRSGTKDRFISDVFSWSVSVSLLDTKKKNKRTNHTHFSLLTGLSEGFFALTHRNHLWCYVAVVVLLLFLLACQPSMLHPLFTFTFDISGI